MSPISDFHHVIHAVTLFLICGSPLAFFILYAGFSFDLNQDINWLHFIAGGLGIIAVTALISSILKALVEAGSISLFAAVADGAKPSARLFWSGVRIFFLPVWGMRLFLGLMCLLISPLIIALLALAMVAGVFSGGWAISAFGALVSVFLGAWPVALPGHASALAAGFRLEKGISKYVCLPCLCPLDQQQPWPLATSSPWRLASTAMVAQG